VVRKTIKRRINQGHDYEKSVVTELAKLLPDALAVETRDKVGRLVLSAARAYDEETDIGKSAGSEDRRRGRGRAVSVLLAELRQEIAAAERDEPAQGYSARRHSTLSGAEWLEAAKSAVGILHDIDIASTYESIDAEVEETSRNAEHQFHAFCRRVLKAYAIAAGIDVREVKVAEYIPKSSVCGQLPSAIVFIKAIAEATCGYSLDVSSVHRATKIAQKHIERSVGAMSDGVA